MKTSLIAGALALVVAGVAFAQLKFDKDGDGAWSFDELQAVRPDLTIEQFNRLDKNGDGLITRDERPMRGHRGGLPHDRV